MQESLAIFPSFKFYNASLEAGGNEENNYNVELFGEGGTFWPNQAVNCVFINVCGQEQVVGSDYINDL